MTILLFIQQSLNTDMVEFKKLLIVFFCCISLPSQARVFRVGPNEPYTKPSQVRNLVMPGDVVEIVDHIYVNDDVVWRTDHITLKGINGTPRIMFDGKGVIQNRKSIWVIAADHITIENIEFSGARVPDKNGAGLRVEGKDLTVKQCRFIGNELGILSGTVEGKMTIKNSEFGYQNRPGTFSHGVYIGNVRHLVFIGNYVHHSDGGHHLKSRARKSDILYNRLSDEAGGNSSYLIDLPNCGDSLVLGNILIQGANTENSKAISYGAEGCRQKKKKLVVVQNNFVNYYAKGGYFVDDWVDAEVLIANNIVLGNIELVKGVAKFNTNLLDKNVSSVNTDYDASSFSNFTQTRNTGSILAQEYRPDYQYEHPASFIPRKSDSHIDIGAFEY